MQLRHLLHLLKVSQFQDGCITVPGSSLILVKLQTSLQSKRSMLAYITYILGTSAVAMMLWLSSTVFIHTSCCKPHIPVKPENVMKLLQTPLFFSYCQHTVTKEIFPWYRVLCCPSTCTNTNTPSSQFAQAQSAVHPDYHNLGHLFFWHFSPIKNSTDTFQEKDAGFFRVILQDNNNP